MKWSGLRKLQNLFIIIFNYPIFKIKNIPITISTFIYIGLMIPAILFTIQACLIWSNHFSTQTIMYLFNTLMFYLTSILMVLYYKFFSASSSASPSYLASLEKSKTIGWIMLFLGVSYGSYVFEDYSNFLRIQGVVADIIVSFLLLRLMLRLMSEIHIKIFKDTL